MHGSDASAAPRWINVNVFILVENIVQDLLPLGLVSYGVMCIVMLLLYQMSSQVTGYMDECSMLACVSRNVIDTECRRWLHGVWSNVTWHHVHCLMPIYRMPSQVTGYMK